MNKQWKPSRPWLPPLLVSLLLFSGGCETRVRKATPTTSASDWSGTKVIGVSGGTVVPLAAGKDSEENIYVLGTTTAALHGQSTTNGFVYVSKFNKTGTRQWTKLFGGSATFTARGAAVDSGGNTYIAGFFSGGTLHGNALVGTQDAALLKVDASGSLEWCKTVGAAGVTVTGQDVAISSSGDIFLVGMTTGTIDSQTVTGTTDLFVTRYDSSGTKASTRLFASAAAAGAATPASAVFSGSDLIITGTSTGDFAGNVEASQGFLLRLTGALSVDWSAMLDDLDNSTSSETIAVDSSGTIYVTGQTNAGINSIPVVGDDDSVLMKYSSTGTQQFVSTWGVDDTDRFSYAITVDGSGNVITGGSDEELQPVSVSNDRDFSVSYFSSTGARIWRNTSANSVTASLFSTEVKALVPVTGGVIAVAQTNDTFNGTTKTGTVDTVLVKLRTDGVIK